MKVLHVLETSAPHTVGYTVRANAIIENQRKLGLDVIAVTSPLFPTNGREVPAVEEINDTRYYRTNHIPPPASASSKLASYWRRLRMLGRYRQAVMEIARKERVDVIHAHSSYSNAYAGVPAAKALGVPLLYEVRTLWGESAVVEDGWRSDSWKPCSASASESSAKCQMRSSTGAALAVRCRQCARPSLGSARRSM